MKQSHTQPTASYAVTRALQPQEERSGVQKCTGTYYTRAHIDGHSDLFPPSALSSK